MPRRPKTTAEKTTAEKTRLRNSLHSLLALVSWPWQHRQPASQQLNRLPANERGNPQRRPGKPKRVASKPPEREGPPRPANAGDQGRLAVEIESDREPEPLPRCRQAEPVAAGDRQERGDVELLVGFPPAP